VGVENARGVPQIERYYFYHSSERIEEVSVNYLWPSEGEDKLFRRLGMMCLLHYAPYLGEKGVHPDDRKWGILDRGFYH
jgi:hypothetical protein